MYVYYYYGWHHTVYHDDNLHTFYISFFEPDGLFFKVLCKTRRVTNYVGDALHAQKNNESGLRLDLVAMIYGGYPCGVFRRTLLAASKWLFIMPGYYLSLLLPGLCFRRGFLLSLN